MEIPAAVKMLSSDASKQILADFLTAYLSPAFGTMPKREIDLLVFEMLGEIKYTKQKPDLYSLVRQLRITRSKARTLLYDSELRKKSHSDLDAELKEVLKSPIVQKQADLFALEVENPLLADHLRSRLKELHHTADGSFSPSLIKLSKSALIAVIDSYLSEADEKEIKKALEKAGVPSLGGQRMLEGVLTKLVEKYAGDVGEELVEKLINSLTPVIGDAAKRLFKPSPKSKNKGK